MLPRIYLSVLICLILFFLFPGLGFGMEDQLLKTGSLPGESVASSGYGHRFQDGNFIAALLFTLQYALLAAVLQLLLGFHTAYSFVRYQLGSIRLIFLLPLLIPPAAGALVWRVLLSSYGGGFLPAILSVLPFSSPGEEVFLPSLS